MKTFSLSSLILLSVSSPVLADSILYSTPTRLSQSTFVDIKKEHSIFVTSPVFISEFRRELSKQHHSFKDPDVTFPPSLEIETGRENLPPILLKPLVVSLNPIQPLHGQILGQKIQDNKACIEIEDIKIFSNLSDCKITLEQEIKSIIQKYSGRILSRIEQENLKDEITLLYIQKGYITSKAELVNNNIAVHNSAENQVVAVRIVEGKLSREIQVEFINQSPNDKVSFGLEDYVRERLQPAINQSPLDVNKLEEQLKLLKNDRLFSGRNGKIEAILRPGNSEGDTILVVKVKENRFNLNIDTNNYAPPSLGAERLRLNLYLGNPITYIGKRLDQTKIKDYGDELFLGFEFKSALPDLDEKRLDEVIKSFFEVAKIDYRIPLGSTRDFLQFRGEFSANEIVQKPFIRSNFRAKSQLYGITYRHIIQSSFRDELSWSAGFSSQKGKTFLFNTVGFPFGIGPSENGVSRTSILDFGLDYIRRDRGGRWLLGTRLNLGTGLLDATRNTGSIPDGQFLSVLGQVQRVQSLGANHLLVAQLDFQLASDSLLPSQQFAIGGQLLRGYRQNVRSGDNGFRLSLEDNITFSWRKSRIGSLIREPILRLIPFVDVGMVWNHPGNPNELPSPNFLASAGLGVSWNISPNLEFRIDYGFPLVDLSDRGQNLQDRGIQFRLNYNL